MLQSSLVHTEALCPQGGSEKTKSGKDHAGATPHSILTYEDSSLVNLQILQSCYCVCGFVCYTCLLIRVVNVETPVEVTCLRRNLTNEKMLNRD